MCSEVLKTSYNQVDPFKQEVFRVNLLIPVVSRSKNTGVSLSCTVRPEKREFISTSSILQSEKKRELL